MSEKIGDYLIVRRLPPSASTLKWAVVASRSGAVLGRIEWRSSWRQYVFLPNRNSEYSAGCMEDLARFLKLVRARRVS